MTEVEKLAFELEDFKFNVAYDAYQEAFKEAESEEEKSELNDMIMDLSKGEVSYPDFYKYLQGGDEWHRFYRTRIETKRKYAYRKEQQEKSRIKRHK